MEKRAGNRARELMFAAIYLPDFALQAALRHAPALHRQPVALLENDEARATIFQLTPSATEAGVRAGMTSSQALARCLRLTIKGRAPAQEKIAGDILLDHAATLAPEIEATAPGVCTVHFSSGKNCRAHVERVVRQLAHLHLSAQVGLATTPDLSFLAACLARPILQVDDTRNFLAPLPIETLLQLLPVDKICLRSAVP
jgi:nucleotidyltransferase/DNA polymerase involved in DNA repair